MNGRLGTYKSFNRKRIGANEHTIEIDGGGRETVKMKDDIKFLVDNTQSDDY